MSKVKQISRVTLWLAAAFTAASTFAQPPQPNPHEMFATLDADGNGSISYAEFAEAGSLRFSDSDSNGDGLLSVEEMLASTPGPRRMKDRIAERVTERHAELDTDGDGLVSNHEASEAAFLRMDDDGDGVLSVEELKPPRNQGRRGGGRRHRPQQAGATTDS